MNEHPILFSTEMVQAILDGRKTQTRRVVKLSSDLWTHEYVTHWVKNERGLWNGFADGIGWPVLVNRECPYGQPGDLLWVRETFMEHHGESKVWYKASQNKQFLALLNELGEKWRPSIHMPRWASRIILEVTGVKVERVRDITVSDMRAEGIEYGPRNPGEFAIQHTIREWEVLWDKINAKRGYSWESNPWVWVVGFKAVN